MEENNKRRSRSNSNNYVRGSESASAKDHDVESNPLGGATSTSVLTHQNNAASQVGVRGPTVASSVDSSTSSREHYHQQRIQQRPPPPCPRQIQDHNGDESNLKTPQPEPPTSAATQPCSSSSLNAQQQLRAAASRIRPMSMNQTYTQYRNQANLRRAANTTNEAEINACTASLQNQREYRNSTGAVNISSNTTTATHPSSAPSIQATPRSSYIPSIPMPLPKVPSCLNHEMEYSNHSANMNDFSEREEIKGEWKVVEVAGNDTGDDATNGRYIASSSPPCERSLHAAALWNDQFLVFGGYDGQSRRNDFYSFHLKKKRWSQITGNGTPPNPRDRHCAVGYGNSFYVFGGFNGTSRVNDFYEFDFTDMTWRHIISNISNGSTPPSTRHSHSAVVYQDSMFLFGGYDGSYRSDFHEYNFLTNMWSEIPVVGRSPRARYRASSVVHNNKMILFGGHDGTRHLSDIHIFDFSKRSWSMVGDILGTPPSARDSHISAVYGDSMFIFGGSEGSGMNDMHELKLDFTGDKNDELVPTWRPVKASGEISPRFCHVGAIHDGGFYVFGGYDGDSRLNDFMKFEFNFDDLSYIVPPSSLLTDLRSFVNNEALSDVIFIVEGKTIYAHKLMLLRCDYFRVMLTGSMRESQLSTINLEDMDISYHVFLAVLEYLYTDRLDIQVESAMELFAVADLFGIPRLQSMCEKKMLESILPENAANIFHAADEHSAVLLRKKSLQFILKHFEQVSKSQAFEDMARNNVELVVEILRLR